MNALINALIWQVVCCHQRTTAHLIYKMSSL